MPSSGGFGWRVSRTPHHTDLFLDIRVPPTKEMGVARREVLEFVRSLAERFPDYGIEGEVYVTAPGRGDRGGPRARRRRSTPRTKRSSARPPGRDVTRWFSDASALTRYGIPTLNYGTSTGLMDVALGENLDIDGLVQDGGDLRARRSEESAREARHVRRRQGRPRRRRRGRSPRRSDDARVLRARRRGRRCPSASPLADVHLRAPIIPKKFFHTAGNFREHEEESKNVDWSHAIAPWINFFQNVDAIVGPDEPVIYPEHLTEELDYELELAVVLKKAGKWFSPEEAADYIGGYVIFNDITARDIQRGEMRSGVFSFCKAIDTFCPLGPWIVTPDEIPDPHNLAMELRVNGEVRQESHSSRMSVTIPEILSNFSALGYSAGDVLSTGTVAGVAGFKSKEERMRLYLKPGDVIEAEIERIGVLRTPVISWQEGHGTPAPPRVRPWGESV